MVQQIDSLEVKADGLDALTREDETIAKSASQVQSYVCYQYLLYTESLRPDETERCTVSH